MSAKPSPSPWSVADVRAGRGIETPTIVDASGSVIAEVVCAGKVPTAEEAANGQILGAAAELLDVVRLGQRLREGQKAPKTRSLDDSNRLTQLAALFDTSTAAVLAKIDG
jgi:hypothetical protein